MAKKKNNENPNAAPPDPGHHDDGPTIHNHEHGGEEGEPWLVSYADMMTLLFGFFVVMYSFAAKDPKNEECVRLKLMEAFRTDKQEVESRPDAQSTQDAVVRSLQMLVTILNLESVDDVMEKISDASERMKAGEFDALGTAKEKDEKVSIDKLKALLGADEIKDTITIAIPVDVMFSPGSAKVLPSATPKLRDVARTIREIRGIESIKVIGHTDSTKNATSPGIDNWSLSVMRAAEVTRNLNAYGIPEKLVRVEGRGSVDPLFPEKNDAGKPILENMKRNRRIEILIMKEKSRAKT